MTNNIDIKPMNAFKVFPFGRVMNDSHFHSHENIQILKVDQGSMQLLTEERTWFVPRDHLILIPAGTKHRAASIRKATGWGLFINGKKAKFSAVTALETSSLLESLIRSILADPEALKTEQTQRAFEILCMRELSKLKPEKLFVPIPKDNMLSAIARKVIENPSKEMKLNYWAKIAGMSERNFSRRFSMEVGMSFEKWRILAIHRKAIEKLSNGDDVASVSYELGYESPSSFIYSFKRMNGHTPGRYLSSKFSYQK